MPLPPAPAIAGSSSSLQSFALRLSDLPRGATAGPARSWSNAQAAVRDGVAPSVYDAHGRITSYEDSFDRSLVDGLPPRGLVRASCEITEYKSSSGAHWYYLRLRSAFRHSGVLGATTGGTRFGAASHLYRYTPVAMPRVGNENAGFKAESSGDEFSYTTRTTIFRRGRYVATLRLVGYQGQFPQRAANALARVIDRRIASG